MILKWVAMRILANIFHAFHMCFIHKLVIVKRVYDKLASFFSMTIPAVEKVLESSWKSH